MLAATPWPGPSTRSSRAKRPHRRPNHRTRNRGRRDRGELWRGKEDKGYCCLSTLGKNCPRTLLEGGFDHRTLKKAPLLKDTRILWLFATAHRRWPSALPSVCIVTPPSSSSSCSQYPRVSRRRRTSFHLPPLLHPLPPAIWTAAIAASGAGGAPPPEAKAAAGAAVGRGCRRWGSRRAGAEGVTSCGGARGAVSYTHLTLPTIA